MRYLAVLALILFTAIASAQSAGSAQTGGSSFSLVQALVSLVTGGLAGAAVNAFITSRKQRLDVTLSVIKDFFSYYEDIGKVKGVLASADIATALGNVSELQRLRMIGDWFNYVANLKKESVVDNGLLNKVGVMKSVADFSESIKAKRSSAPALESAWSWWENLEHFKIT